MLLTKKIIIWDINAQISLKSKRGWNLKNRISLYSINQSISPYLLLKWTNHLSSCQITAFYWMCFLRKDAWRLNQFSGKKTFWSLKMHNWWFDKFGSSHWYDERSFSITLQDYKNLQIEKIQLCTGSMQCM